MGGLPQIKADVNVLEAVNSLKVKTVAKKRLGKCTKAAAVHTARQLMLRRLVRMQQLRREKANANKAERTART